MRGGEFAGFGVRSSMDRYCQCKCSCREENESLGWVLWFLNTKDSCSVCVCVRERERERDVMQ